MQITRTQISDFFLRSSLIWLHSVCFHDKVSLIYIADIISRHFLNKNISRIRVIRFSLFGHTCLLNFLRGYAAWISEAVQLLLTLYQLVATLSSADNICKQLGSRPGLTKCQSWSGSKLLGTLMVFLQKNSFKKLILKKSADDKITQHAKN